jgi:hypothetical protein
MFMRLRSFAIAIIALGLASSLVQAATSTGSPYGVHGRFMVGGPGGWDYLIVDPRTHSLLISRSDRVLVVNGHDASLVATIPDTPGVHGIALAPTHRVYLVAAEFGAAPAPAKDRPHPRAPVLDDTFTVLVVGN